MTIARDVWLWVLLISSATADEIQVAVAANFSAPAQKIVETFTAATGHKVALSAGSTGKLYAQIKNGAPFDVLLSADAQTPAKLETEGFGVSGSRFVYATGRLVLWSRRAGWVDDQGEVLGKGAFEHLAIADPKLAPYGAAAMEVLEKRNLVERLRPKFVQGENIAQTHQFVTSGSAELGFLALSQVMREGKIPEGSAWIVPAGLHRPILQEAVLLEKGRDNPAARAWLDHLRAPATRAMIATFGYE
ncbi:Molybdate transport system substrate-binding [Candidatus Magnetaquicoccaceae bacterium FCR-1]|uniref:Molybdate transport system substrate-binding n=1 Tax=Candidatus Magnetaquiglobus chichijimensis TaxID=3141448 RepID=A0ABQ0C8W1_9PROT